MGGGRERELDVVQAQFEEEAKLGAMVEVSLDGARARYGDRLVLASLGALEKKDGAWHIPRDS